jgi:hypothetical protein
MDVEVHSLTSCVLSRTCEQLRSEVHPLLPEASANPSLRTEVAMQDVMLQTHSSHRAEGASPPSPRCSDAKKANTETFLQFYEVSCSCRDTPSASWDNGWQASKY